MIRQFVEPRAEQEAIPLHRGEILAIYPDQIDGTALGTARRFLGKNPGNGFRRVRQLHMHDRNAIPRVRLLPRPVDIGIDPGIAAPGVPVNGLAAGCIEHLLPVRIVSQSRGVNTSKAENQRKCSETMSEEHGGTPFLA